MVSRQASLKVTLVKSPILLMTNYNRLTELNLSTVSMVNFSVCYRKKVKDVLLKKLKMIFTYYGSKDYLRLYWIILQVLKVPSANKWRISEEAERTLVSQNINWMNLLKSDVEENDRFSHVSGLFSRYQRIWRVNLWRTKASKRGAVKKIKLTGEPWHASY